MSQGSQSLMRAPSPYLSSDLVLVESVTHLHVGVGRSGGVVDLPVQRDENGFPCIYSSSLKGALKTALLWAATKKHNNSLIAKKAVEALLGPEPEPEESFESAVAMLDARLVAMPVRSLKGVYVYVTSPLLLERLRDYVELCARISGPSSEQSGTQGGGQPSAERGSAVAEILRDLDSLIKEADGLQGSRCVCVGDPQSVSVKELGDRVVLVEELALETRTSAGNFTQLAKFLDLERPLLVLEDDTARHVVERSLLRIARVRLSRGTKTVETGPWIEEYVPSRTRFATVFLYKKPSLAEGFVRSLKPSVAVGAQIESPVDDAAYLDALATLGLIDSSARDKVRNLLAQKNLTSAVSQLAGEVGRSLRDLLNQLDGYLVVGGHETIGKGIVSLRVLDR